MKKLVLLSAGHSNTPGRDQGAAANGFIEGHLAVEFRELVADNLIKLGISPYMDGNDTILADSLKHFKKIQGSENSICMDIHWNSGSSTAQGTETFVPANANSAELSLASDLSKAVNSVLDIPIRGGDGVKSELESHHKKLGWMTLKGTNVLMEVCFITNITEMDKYQDNKHLLAKTVAQVLFNHATGKKGNSNLPKTPDQFKIHEVLSGQSLGLIASMYSTTVKQIASDNNIADVNNIYIGQEIKIRK